MERQYPQVTVVVVHHNTPDYLHSSLKRIDAAMDGLNFEIVVVDNGSVGNGKPGLKPGGNLRMVYNRENRGFAVAANQGAAFASSPYLLFLNSEVKLTEGCVSSLVRVLESNPGLAAVAPLGLGLEGTERFPGMKFLNPFNHAAALLGLPAKGPLAREWPFRRAPLAEVDWITASTMLTRRQAFRDACGFDEHYFFFEEDEDLCWRLRRRGYGVAVFSGVRVFDPGGITTAQVGIWPVAELYRGQKRFMRRRGGRVAALLYSVNVSVALSLKAVASWLSPALRWRSGVRMAPGELSLALRTLWRGEHGAHRYWVGR